VNPSFRGDHHLVAPAFDRLGDQPLAFAISAVAIGRVEEVDSQVEARADRRQAVGLADIQARHAGNGPTPQRDGGNPHAGIAERAVVHGQVADTWLSEWLAAKRVGGRRTFFWIARPVSRPLPDY